MEPTFNSDRAFFNKWEMYQIVKEQKIPHFNIPSTDILSLPSLKDYIDLYQSIFIKPVSLWGGQNISKVALKNQQLVWCLQGQPQKNCSTVEDLFAELSTLYNDGLYIVQQEAPLILYEDRPFNIRTHMQHDLEDGWIYSGDLIRLGGTDSIVSNVAISNGSVKPTNDVLFPLFKNLTTKIKQELNTSSMHICHLLDEHYFFLEAGIDFGVDNSGEIWLIEVNTNDLLGGPDQQLFKNLPDEKYFNDIIKRKDRINEQTVRKLFELYENHFQNNNSDENLDNT